MSCIKLFNRTVLTAVYLVLIFSSLGLGRNKDIDPAVTFSNDVASADASGTPDTKVNDNSPFKLGFKVGPHTANLDYDYWKFEIEISFEAYLRYDFENEVYLSVGYSYWESSSKGIYYPRQNFFTRGIKIDLDLTLFAVNNFSVLIGPSVFIESVSPQKTGLLSFAPQLKFNHSFGDDGFSIVSTLAYKTGVEESFFNLAGGNHSFSFFNFLIGLEIDPWRLAR